MIGLLLEAGIEMDVAQLKETGARSLGMAVTGATIPMLMGVGLTFAYGGDIRSAIALGACFSPTSLGVASNALNAGNVANTPVGQLIVSTCVLDDIIGLILLGMLQVIVKEDAQVWEYFIPIISSVGYLLVLGWSGLTWMPKLIENRILPRFPERLRDTIVFFMMMMLLLAYLPLLYYSKSSYLTGAFLAGLTFSQIHSIHSTFANEMGSLMNWLLRIFFAASIGFQVPITKFGDSDIVKWGFIFCKFTVAWLALLTFLSNKILFLIDPASFRSVDVCVLGKLPLGFFVPRFQLTIPDGFPFNPYVRDFIYVSVAMTCRGEFSFVIASFALQEGLFSTEMYSSVVFAVLLSCITSPFALLSIIKYYNRKSEAFLESLLDEKDADGKIPLYLAIQVRTPNQWGLQETIQSALKRAGLVVIDHRSWHPRGMDADVMTELYVEDTELRVPKKKMTEISQSFLDVEGTIREEDVSNVMEAVDDRCAVVKKALEDLLGHADQTRVVVTWWQPTSINQEDASDANEALGDRLKTEAQSEMTTHERFGLQLPQPRRRRERTLSVPKIGQDMWGSDVPAKDAAFSDAYSPQPPSKVMAGRYRYGQRRKIQSDLTGFMFMEAAPSTEEHLAGLVRRDNEQSTEFGMLHPGDRHASVKDLRVQREKTKSDVTGLFDRRSTSWLPRGKAKSDLSGLDIQGGIKEEEKEDEDNSRAGG